MAIASQTKRSAGRTGPQADPKLLRLSATLLLIGFALLTIITLFLHPGGGSTLEATFANDAASRDWTAIHLGQFVGMAVLLTGLLVLFFALNLSEGPSRWVGFFGAISAGVALALASVQYAVDGVANKRAVDAWVAAPAAEKATRFATAEALRWVEMGAASYQNLMFGVALLLVAIVIVWTGRAPRAVGYLMGLSGLAWLVVGWLVGTRGFTSADTLPTYVQGACLPISSLWLLTSTWRIPESPGIAPESRSSGTPE